MKTYRLLPILLTLAAILAPATARADWLQQLVRSTGLGWSDGYHAYPGCPRCGPQPQAWSEPDGPHFPLWNASERPKAPPLAPAPAIRRDLPPPPDPSAFHRGPVIMPSRLQTPTLARPPHPTIGAAYFEAANHPGTATR